MKVSKLKACGPTLLVKLLIPPAKLEEMIPLRVILINDDIVHLQLTLKLVFLRLFSWYTLFLPYELGHQNTPPTRSNAGRVRSRLIRSSTQCIVGSWRRGNCRWLADWQLAAVGTLWTESHKRASDWATVDHHGLFCSAGGLRNTDRWPTTFFNHGNSCTFSPKVQWKQTLCFAIVVLSIGGVTLAAAVKSQTTHRGIPTPVVADGCDGSCSGKPQ